MTMPDIIHCPGTLAAGNTTYSRTCLRRMFNGRKVDHVLPYDPPKGSNNLIFLDNQKRISLSGVQEKFSVLLAKNKLRLTEGKEQGTYILKPIPSFAKNPDQIPANEHLTMQIARQVFGIETAENALVFFKNGEPAYLTKRFDVKEDDRKWAVEDFASLIGRTPQTHGEHYKYSGNYLELFDLLKKHLPAYKVEAPKLFKLLLFNYLFSNGDAHLKNFSLLETPMGDFRLSPAYDLLNTRMHVADSDFALADGLLPKSLAKGKVKTQFHLLGEHAGMTQIHRSNMMHEMLSKSEEVRRLIEASFLNEKAKRSYLQGYQGRLKKMGR